MYDEIWQGGPKFTDSDECFKMTTDSILLSHFAKTAGKRLVCDLGCGGGALGVLLCWDNPSVTVHGVEIDPRAAAVAEENARINNISNRLLIYNEDLRNTTLAAGAYDAAAANPPYFTVKSGALHREKSLARQDGSCTLEDICSAAARLIKWGGKLYMVHRPERLSELFCTMASWDIEPKGLMMVCSAPTASPSLVLVEGKKGAKSGLIVHPPLITRNPDGGESEQLREIYHKN